MARADDPIEYTDARNLTRHAETIARAAHWGHAFERKDDDLRLQRQHAATDDERSTWSERIAANDVAAQAWRKVEREIAILVDARLSEIAAALEPAGGSVVAVRLNDPARYVAE